MNFLHLAKSSPVNVLSHSIFCAHSFWNNIFAVMVIGLINPNGLKIVVDILNTDLLVAGNPLA